MSVVTFEESGMRFSFEDTKIFRIEKDPLVNRLSNVKCCECVSKINDFIVFIEAKTTSPKCMTFDSSKISYNGDELPINWSVKSNFDIFIEDVSRKFQDSFFFIKASMEGWHGEAKKKELLPKFTITNTNLRFILIIKRAEVRWLQDINDGLKNNLRHFLKAWNIPDSSLKVINPSMAHYLEIPLKPI